MACRFGGWSATLGRCVLYLRRANPAIQRSREEEPALRKRLDGGGIIHGGSGGTHRAPDEQIVFKFDVNEVFWVSRPRPRCIDGVLAASSVYTGAAW